MKVLSSGIGRLQKFKQVTIISCTLNINGFGLVVLILSVEKAVVDAGLVVVILLVVVVSWLVDDVEVDVEITVEVVSFVDNDDEGNDDVDEDEVNVADVVVFGCIVVLGLFCWVDAWIGNWLL